MMAAQYQFTLLGTGSSSGVPRVGGDWGVCDPAEPRNRRRRCGALVDRIGPDGAMTRVLIDTSPDLREQLLDANVQQIDGVVWTHDHADQTHGIDDVRALVNKSRMAIPAYMDAATAATLAPKFDYCFEGKGGYPPLYDLQPRITPATPFTIDGPGGAITLFPLDQEHGRIRSLGFRIGNLAYCNDVNQLPAETLAALIGVKVFIVDALRPMPHPSHAHLDRALEWIAALRPTRAVLTNLHIDMDYASLQRDLPDGVEPGHDGLTIPFHA